MKDEFGGLGGGSAQALEEKKALAAAKLSEAAKRLNATTAKLTKAVKSGTATKTTTKAVRTLLGFDEINRLKVKTVKTAKKKAAASKSGSSRRTSAGKAASKAKKSVDGLWSSLKKLWSLKGTALIGQLMRMSSAARLAAKGLKTGLGWCYENILVPLNKWTMKKALPALLGAAAAAFRVFSGELRLLAPVGRLVMKGVLLPLSRWTGNTVIKTLNGVNTAFSQLYSGMEAVKKLLTGGLPEALAQLSETVLSKVPLDGIKKVGETVSQWFEEHVMKPLKSKLPVVTIKLDWDSNQLGTLWKNLQAKWGNGKTLKALVSLAKNGWSSVTAWVGKSTAVSVAVNLVKKGWKSVKDWLGELTAKFNIKLPKVSVTWSGSPIKLPRFNIQWNARGGILDGATLFGMSGNTLLGGGEAGREAVLPLDRNTGWMDGLAEKVAQRVRGGQPIVVQVTLDGRLVGQSVVDYVNGQARATGVHPMATYL